MKLVIALVAALALGGAAYAAPDPQLATALEHAMAGRTVPAMGVLRIEAGEAGEPVVRGVRRLGEAEPVHADDRWLLGSDTKAMTAVLVARLVEAGQLSWTAPLADMLPDLAAGMRPEYRGATLLDLLSHRTGLPENLGDLARFQAFYDDPRPPAAQRMDYIALALAEAPVAAPRTEPHYSNTGYVIAGVIAERAAAKPYETLMAEQVFAPLGMASARFLPWVPPGPTGHVDGRPATQPQDPNPPMFDPAGGASMSLSDWAKFCLDQIAGAQGRGRLLKPEGYRAIQTGQGETRSGLGWGVQSAALGRKGPALTHTGSDGNWFAAVILFPQAGDGLLVTANAADSMGGDKAAVAVLKELAPSLSEPLPPESP
jgi:CubicO group peptidase (beta-lactamase class C family)